MGCASCGSGTNENGTPKGCGSKGACNTASCNKRSTYDWLADLGIDDPYADNIVEVSFKAGASQGFYHAPADLEVFTGDTVAVEADNGYNVGRVTLSGELVRLQMKKKRVTEAKVNHSVLRRANVRDLEKLAEARELEPKTLLKARAIARQNHVKLKVTDVEYQGDARKATIYYTAEERIDFRELVRQYSHQFRVKIEMRQIGPRQETARLGGVGVCGRELCCSTWLSDFSLVNTAAARYQNLAINQQKLSGQCGRLKCCLNYELDAYMEALEAFPKKADKIKTGAGLAILIKTDIFKGVMYYTYRENRGLLYPIPVAKVHEFIELNKAGQTPADLQSHQLVVETEEEDMGYEDVTGAVDLPAEKRRKRRRKGGKPRGKGARATTVETEKPSGKKATATATKEEGKDTPTGRSKRRRGRGNRKPTGEQLPKASGPANSTGKPADSSKTDGGGKPSSGRRKQRRGRRKPPAKD